MSIGCGRHRGGTIAGNPGSGGGRSATIVWIAGATVENASRIQIAIEEIRLIGKDGASTPLNQRRTEFDISELSDDQCAQVTEVLFANTGEYVGLELTLNSEGSLIEFATSDARFVADASQSIRIERPFEISDTMDTDLVLNFELQKLVSANLASVPARLVTEMDAGNVIGQFAEADSLVCIYSNDYVASHGDASCTDAVSVALANSDGEFKFANLPSGDYIIATSKNPIVIPTQVQARKAAILSQEVDGDSVKTEYVPIMKREKRSGDAVSSAMTVESRTVTSGNTTTVTETMSDQKTRKSVENSAMPQASKYAPLVPVNGTTTITSSTEVITTTTTTTTTATVSSRTGGTSQATTKETKTSDETSGMRSRRDRNHSD